MGRQSRNFSESLQVFIPSTLVEITDSVAWTVPANAVAFRVPSSCTYTINGGVLTAGLQAGSITGIHSTISTLTFNTTMNIEVMT